MRERKTECERERQNVRKTECERERQNVSEKERNVIEKDRENERQKERDIETEEGGRKDVWLSNLFFKYYYII